MAFIYEELDFRTTPLGDLLLRRRQSPQLPGVDIFEVKLGDYFLMSSLFHEAEHQLSKLGLAEVEGDDLEVVVGGLGLGYTAVSALEETRVKRLIVIDYLEAVIEWHQQKLVPLGEPLSTDPRCELRHADFFECSKHIEKGFDAKQPGKKFDAILLDIDHTPSNLLHPSNASFYGETGLTELKAHLKPNGVFALWADGKPEPSFIEHLHRIFGNAQGHTIEFDNPVAGGVSHGAVYVAKLENK